MQCQVKTQPPSSSQWGVWLGVPGNKSLISKDRLDRVRQERAASQETEVKEPNAGELHRHRKLF